MLWLLVSMALLAGGSPALAIDPTEALTELHHTQWTVREGAPAQIGALAQGSDGFLWVGAASGLYRFDGERFTRFALADGSQPITSNVSALLALPTGELWVGMRFGGAYLVRAHSFTAYGEDSGLPHRSIIQFARRNDRSVWAQTPGGLYRLSDNKWTKVGAAWSYPASVGYSVLLDSHGALWSRGADGTFVLPAGAVTFQKTPVSGGQGWLTNCLHGEVWVSDFEAGIRRISGAGDVVTGTSLAGGEPGTGAILCDREGSLWTVVYNKDASRLIRLPDAKRALSGAIGESHPPAQELASGARLSGEQPGRLLEDREGNIWLSTLGGLDRFRSNKLHSATESVPLARAAMATDSAGNVWFANNTNIVSFADGATQPRVQSFPGDATHWLSHFAIDADGGLLVAQQGQELIRYRNGHGQPVNIPTHDKLTTIQAIAKDSAGALWVSISGDAAYRQSGDRWVINGGIAALPHGVPVTLRLDRKGRLWFGYADNRVAVLEGEQARVYDAHDGLKVGAVLAIEADSDPVWIAGADNVEFLARGHFSALTNLDGSPLSGNSGVVQDNTGTVWLNGTMGVVRITAAEAARAVRDPTHRVAVEVLDYEDGLNGAAPQVRPLPTALKGGDGRLWFLTDLGAYWIDPLHIQRNSLPPTVKINSVIAAERTYEAAATVNLPLHATGFQIDYTALSLSIPSRIQFKYRLDGVDAVWQNAGNRRQAFYTNVPPGEHRFVVKAANEDSVWSEDGAAATIYIPPALYQTRLFTVFCVAIGVGLLWLIYLWRVRILAERMRGRLEERLSERERIARALHDILLQSMQGLIFRFQTIAERLPTDEPNRRLMEKELDRADTVLAEGRDQVAGLRANSSGSMDLAQVITDFANSLTQEHSATFNLTIEGQPQALHPLVQEEIVRIACEALANAFRHSQATQIEVELAFNRSELRVRVRDNGVGIDAQTLAAGSKSGHWGLVGMGERAAKIRAGIELWSRTGAGTEVALVVSGAVAYDEPRRGWRSWLRRARRSS
jgi:signal transduction histidine kinase/ligand-binding sensor domain-containing protein